MVLAAVVIPQRLPAAHPAQHRRCWRLASTSSGSGVAPLHRQQNARYLITVQRGFVQDAVGVSRLLAQTFVGSGMDEDADGGRAAPSGTAILQYQLKLLAALQWRASTLGQSFVTVTAVDRASGELAGVANVTPGLSIADAEDHLELGPADVAVAVSNMAVAPGHRRRGLGRRLLTECETAAATGRPPATLVGLVVYRFNEAAVQLYETSGYEVDGEWVDQRWADSAERGRVAFQRRQLMLKPINGGRRPPPRRKPKEAQQQQQEQQQQQQKQQAEQQEQQRRAGPAQ